jgi:Domain of unknown function (DUF4307)
VAEQRTDTLAVRYGRTRTRRTRDRLLLIAGAVAVAIVVIAWVVWAGLDGRNPSIEATDTGHRLMNEQRAVEVSWTLSVPPGNETACIVEALDDAFTVVGWRVVEIPASDRHLRSFTETVRVAREATTGLISRCWLT